MSETFTAGTNLLKRGIDLETKGRLIESLTCYTEGIDLYLTYLKTCPQHEKEEVKMRSVHFMTKAENLKKIIKSQKELSTYHEEIKIADDSTGNSYEKVFGRFLDKDVVDITVEDPYISNHHQLNNFLRFCELAVKNCPNIKRFYLCTTSKNADVQDTFFSGMQSELATRNINLIVNYSSTLHDRQIRISNGYVIKLGRGLGYFKAPTSKMAIGYFDLDLRPCHQTDINVFFDRDLKRKATTANS